MFETRNLGRGHKLDQKISQIEINHTTRPKTRARMGDGKTMLDFFLDGGGGDLFQFVLP